MKILKLHQNGIECFINFDLVYMFRPYNTNNHYISNRFINVDITNKITNTVIYSCSKNNSIIFVDETYLDILDKLPKSSKEDDL